MTIELVAVGITAGLLGASVGFALGRRRRPPAIPVIKAGGKVVIESPRIMSRAEVERIRAQWRAATGTEAIVMDGVHVAAIVDGGTP